MKSTPAPRTIECVVESAEAHGRKTTMEGDVRGEGGAAPRPAFEELLDALQSLSLRQMDSVAASWHQVPRHQREAAWAVVRGFCRATASDDSLDAAFTARRAASRAARLAGARDWAFASAACDAGLALASPYELEDRSHVPLVTPMARALPWLLERSPESRDGRHARVA
jgi:hypothetical protein